MIFTQFQGSLRETWEFVNLYSIYRGGNRFISIIKVFELVEARRDHVKQSGVKLARFELRLRNGLRLKTSLVMTISENIMKRIMILIWEKVLRWTEAVNQEIDRLAPTLPPFPHAKTAMKMISSFADLVIVSQTPLEALEREWKENDLKNHIRFIAGQEHGTKTEHIALAAKGNILMIKYL